MKTEPNHPINGTMHAIAENIYDMQNKGLLVGLTKREYFAAMAMQGMLANPNPGVLTNIVKWSIEAADTLIYELNKTPNE